LTSAGSGSPPAWATPTVTSPAGSTGQIQYNNAGAFGAISSGTSGQVLTSAGAGAAPAWASPAGGGSWIYLSTVTASNSATVVIDTTFDSTYQNYALVVSNLRGDVDGTDLRMVNKLGASFVTSSDYIWHLMKPTSQATTYSANASAGSGLYYRVANPVSAYPYESAQFIMYIHNPSSTDSFKSIYSVGTTANVVATVSIMAGYCGTGNTSPLTALRFYMGSGNIVNGTFRLYGIKNS
jgi:hypothetical protein